MSIGLIMEMGEKVLGGGQLKREEATELATIPDSDLPFLFAMADKIRQHFVGDEVDLCAIVNGRSGMCSEDCTFCAQSAYHQSGVAIYPIMDESKLVEAAKTAEANGALRFAIVTSGRGMEKDAEFPLIIKALKQIQAETSLRVCCSLGTLSAENAKALKAAGVSRYHHNVETSRSHYSAICSTHTYDDRVATVKIAQDAGLEVCSGGIVGLGETMEQRLEMAFELKALNIDSVPMNILNPVKGTVLANQPSLPPRDIIKTFALFRFILPNKGIRTAGGREVNLRDLQALSLLSGVNGMMIGNYLTTNGREATADLTMLHDLGRRQLSAMGV